MHISFITLNWYNSTAIIEKLRDQGETGGGGGPGGSGSNDDRGLGEREDE